MSKNLQVATIGGGCFWCTEAIFLEIKGVEKVVAGYAGGTVPGKPTYREICSGLTGHAEVIQITFTTDSISYEEILAIFMTTHNPTTLNQQGADKGTQYRSVIFYHNTHQQQKAKEVISQIQLYYNMPIVTEITALPIFYKAEEAHQNYYRQHKEQKYCNLVIAPKLAKLKELHPNKLASK